MKTLTSSNSKYPGKGLSTIGMLISITILFCFTTAAAQDVVINELMPDNETSVQDPAGEYDDWLELYNNSDEPVDLSGWFMSDDANELDEWAFPDGTSVDAKGYLIVWCDEDLEQEGLHADFKMSSGGETIYLCTPDLGIVQEIAYTEATTDQSYSRVPNGSGSFVWQNHTFNGPNETTAVDEIVQNSPGILCYPVPAREIITIEYESPENESMKIYTLSGKLIWAEVISSPAKVNVQSWPTGMYILMSDSGTKRKIIIR